MLINKILECSVDILDPNEIYQANIESVIINKLELRYKGKCFQSILILTIVKIIRRSSIKMVDNRLDGSAYVDVQFEVSGMVYAQDEILHNCKIIEIHSNTMIVSHEYAGIKLQKELGGNISKILQVDQIIPVVVQRVRYNTGKTSISIIAKPYIPTVITPNIYYNIIKGLTGSESDNIDRILEQITQEEKMHKKLEDEKSYAFFKDILYPYKIDQQYEQNPDAIKLGLKPISFVMEQLLKIEKGTITYPSEDNKINKRLFWSKGMIKQSIDEKIVIIDSPLYPVLADVIYKYLLYMQSLRGFMETYGTVKSAQELTLYWKLCKNTQL